ncbi:MAG: trypsin-like peptidase domain-containing protein [Planctomycetes bacterium]|nr:trypsin-like peptidase domain-containing protein [Planctomycetota bacterium]
MRRFLAFGPAFVVLLATAVVLLVAPNAIRRINAANVQGVVAVAQRSLDSDDVLERLNRATRNIADAVEPSVVHIEVYDSGRSLIGASGSGWIFDNLGHVVTNAHVVGAADSIEVQFFDGHSARAKIVGLDTDSDIAVIKVENASDRTPARRASGERLHIGDRVYAFGSPFGFKFSMSEGIVSGLGRSARTPMPHSRIANFIQFDAAVNPGNSGGPLVDIRGRVVGMNVAIATAADSRGGGEGQSSGISFAIPLGTIDSRVRQLIGGGVVASGYLGVWYTDNQGRAENGKPRGVTIDDVIDDGPAEKAGLKVGDLVLNIDGEAVTDGGTMSSIISAREPGQQVSLDIWRDGKTMELSVTLGERTETNPIEQYKTRLWRRYGVEFGDDGAGRVVIARIAENSPASDADLTPGARVVGILGIEPPSAAIALRAFGSSNMLRGRSIRFTVRDDNGNDREVTLKQRDEK